MDICVRPFPYMSAPKYLFKIYFKNSESTCTGTPGNGAFKRLSRRYTRGEIDPRENGWRLVPVEGHTWEDIKNDPIATRFDSR